MTDIRSLRLAPPDGNWAAVSLREASSPEGPWETVQACRVNGPGTVTVAFRPRVANGFYRPLWVAEGGSRAGLAEGEIVRLPAAVATTRGKIARPGGA